MGNHDFIALPSFSPDAGPPSPPLATLATTPGDGADSDVLDVRSPSPPLATTPGDFWRNRRDNVWTGRGWSSSQPSKSWGSRWVTRGEPCNLVYLYPTLPSHHRSFIYFLVAHTQTGGWLAPFRWGLYHLIILLSSLLSYACTYIYTMMNLTGNKRWLSECTLQPVVSCMKNPLPGLHFGLRVKVELSAILNVSVSYCISLQLLEGARNKLWRVKTRKKKLSRVNEP